MKQTRRSFDNKAVVTGGAGFIGSHIVEALVRSGRHVVALDDLSSGKLENINHLPKDRLEFVSGSVTDLGLLESVLHGADVIFHEAAIASVPLSLEKPEATHEVNLTGTLNVLRAAKHNSVGKVVFASSCAIYGNDAILPTPEHFPADPQSPYAVSKLAAEYYCDVFRKVYGLSTICLRYFNVYGPRQSAESDYAAAIPRFINLIGGGKSPVVFGDGEQSRDFVFVRDVVAANLLAAESDLAGVYNIGTGESVSVNRLADMIMKLYGHVGNVVHEAARLGEVRHSRADNSRAMAFGYRSAYTLERGLREMLQKP